MKTNNKNSTDHSKPILRKILLIGILLIPVYWVLDAAMHVFVFHQGDFIRQVFITDWLAIWHRSLVVCLIIMLSVYVQYTITERKRVEEALREGEERYRTLYENAPIGIYRTTPDGRILMANPTLIRMLRFSSFDELASRNLEEEGFEATYPRSQFKERIEQEGEVIGLEAAWVRRDNSVIFVRENAKAVRRKDGDVLYYEGTVEDITERKRAEEALRGSEKSYRALAENLPGIVYRVFLRENNRMQFFNNMILSMTGFPAENLITGKACSIDPLILPEDRPNVIATVKQAIHEDKPFQVEYRLRHKDGDIRYFLERGRPIRGADGKPLYIDGVIFNITERKRAEEALRESEERFRIASQIASDVVYERDAQTGIATFYGDIDSHLGYEPGGYPRTMEGWRNHVNPEDLAWIDTESIDQLEPGVPHGIEYRMRKKDGTYMIWSDRIMIIRDEKTGKPVKFIGAATDITERKRAEEVLRESEQRLSAFMNSATDGILIFDSELNLIEANKSALKMLGLNKADVIGKNILDISPDVREKGRYDRYLKVMKSGEPFSIDNLVLHPKFGERHLTIKAFKVGEGLGIIGTDITEQKKMEAQLIQAERLSAVGTLAYGIAHEFNNILAGILCNAEFGKGSDDPGEVKECLQIIMESCDRAKGITNGLLAFSRQGETKRQRADVTEAVETVLGLTERDLEKQNIRVVRKFSPIPQIACDLGELSGVVLNMIINARDAMKPEGGTLTIEIEKKGDNIEFIFTDTGRGIPDSIKPRIFEPFVTTKGALGKSEIPGTGLGLFLSYGIINGYGGDIEVKSKVGKGSRFTIRIPISKNQLAPVLLESKEDKQVTVPQNLTILLVDDEEPICTAIKKFFEIKGHSVTAALSGKKGLKIFKKGGFDLVLADITMPDMDGIELISKLREINQQVKFIVLTGHIAEDKLKSAKKAGADQILMKPFRNEELYQAVSKVLSV